MRCRGHTSDSSPDDRHSYLTGTSRVSSTHADRPAKRLALAHRSPKYMPTLDCKHSATQSEKACSPPAIASLLGARVS
eukprot:33026-Rhodomonas_salina.1